MVLTRQAAEDIIRRLQGQILLSIGLRERLTARLRAVEKRETALRDIIEIHMLRGDSSILLRELQRAQRRNPL